VVLGGGICRAISVNGEERRLSFAGWIKEMGSTLNYSLGMDAFTSMRKINVRDVSLALFIEPKVKDLKVEQQVRSGQFKFPIGSAISVKLVKALAYHFRNISLIDQPYYNGPEPVDALMRVTLQGADVTMGVKSGFATVSTESYTRLALRAEIEDFREKKTVWVGTTQTKETGSHEEMGQMSYQEAGRGFAAGIDIAIDKAIGDLMYQMAKSQNLASFLDDLEKRNKGQHL
jgi:hypothetical protein